MINKNYLSFSLIDNKKLLSIQLKWAEIYQYFKKWTNLFLYTFLKIDYRYWWESPFTNSQYKEDFFIKTQFKSCTHHLFQLKRSIIHQSSSLPSSVDCFSHGLTKLYGKEGRKQLTIQTCGISTRKTGEKRLLLNISCFVACLWNNFLYLTTCHTIVLLIFSYKNTSCFL